MRVQTFANGVPCDVWVTFLVFFKSGTERFKKTFAVFGFHVPSRRVVLVLHTNLRVRQRLVKADFL